MDDDVSELKKLLDAMTSGLTDQERSALIYGTWSPSETLFVVASTYKVLRRYCKNNHLNRRDVYWIDSLEKARGMQGKVVIVSTEYANALDWHGELRDILQLLMQLERSERVTLEWVTV